MSDELRCSMSIQMQKTKQKLQTHVNDPTHAVVHVKVDEL